MKIRTMLAASAALIALSTPAHAAKIIGELSFTGFVAPIGSTKLIDATGLDFLHNNGKAGFGTILSYIGSSGVFAGAICTSGSCGEIADLPTFTGGPINGFLNFYDSLYFDLASISSVQRDPDAANGSLKLIINGTFRAPYYWENTPAVLTLTTQGSGFTTFSATVFDSAVPEPASWAMMIAGFAMLGGALRYSRKSVRVGYSRG
ncbi:PEPxxWA-CTERM sorting domain-containing protein [Sphingomonas sp. TDK1]|uniref:PEPxxWA-CTERM sorting domain-containing protein n=1 Tax=Sphingomonas sp. TDK1 TaxID=453247 RepID=UPI0007D95518|nr:PEPxxWA-CTERM sorting domain-containing protein [Sphingomonas sp. TDK1]OAN61580.1 hypothetical protein A7X12_23570 [Sphingomonas sp. TDK1]